MSTFARVRIPSLFVLVCVVCGAWGGEPERARAPKEPDGVAEFLRGAGYDPVALVPNGDAFLVKASADDKALILTLDTAAPQLYLAEAARRRLGFKVAGPREPGADGDESGFAGWTVLPEFRLGTRQYGAVRCPVSQFRAVEANAAAHGAVVADGLLGVNVLRGARAVIDYRHRRLWLADPADEGLNRMQGRWVAHRGFRGRKPLPDAEAAVWTLEFQGDSVVVETGRGLYRCKPRLDPTVDPPTLDLIHPSGKHAYCGVFRWEGGDWHWCFWAEAGTAAAPPKEFKTAPGDGYLHLVLRRDPPPERLPPPRVVGPAVSELGRRLAALGYHRVPLRLGKDGSPHVTAKAGDADLDLIVDTGAGRNVIREESAGRAKANPVLFPWVLGSLFSWEVGVLALGDRPAWMLRGTVPSLTLGPAALKDVRVLMPEWPELKAAHTARGWPVPDGILGHSLLAKYGAFIDLGDMALYLAERADVTREELRGRWVAGHVERGGRSTSAGKRPEWAFEFSGDRATARAPGGTRAYRVKANPATEPMTLDLEAAGPAAGPDLPDRWTGIYLFAQGGLYLCLSPDGRRPAAFETGPADNFVLFALARESVK